MSHESREAVLERVTTGSAHHPDINWEAAENSTEFKELIASRRKFVLPATIFFFAWYFVFILLAGYAEGFMGTTIYRGLTVGYALALTQFVMVWGLSLAYLKKADRDWEPLEQRAAARAVQSIKEDLGMDRGGKSGGAVTR